MIQITKKTDYAIVVLAHFAQFADYPLLSSREISEATKLSLPMAAKILKILVQKGLLKSHQGVKGGYQLARNASEISIAEIIEAIEGPMAITECTMETAGLCKTEFWCSLKPHWAMINREIQKALDHLPLSAMVSPFKEPVALNAGPLEFFKPHKGKGE